LHPYRTRDLCPANLFPRVASGTTEDDEHEANYLKRRISCGAASPKIVTLFKSRTKHVHKTVDEFVVDARPG